MQRDSEMGAHHTHTPHTHNTHNTHPCTAPPRASHVANDCRVECDHETLCVVADLFVVGELRLAARVANDCCGNTFDVTKVGLRAPESS